MADYQPPAELIAAQNALQQRRQNAGILPWSTHEKRGTAPTPMAGEISAELPAHLGWYANTLKTPPEPKSTPSAWPILPPITAPMVPAPPPSKRADLPRDGVVKVYPEIAIAILGSELTRAGNLFARYLTFRFADTEGGGNVQLVWPANKAQRKKLQRDLKAGEGIFWTQDKTNDRLFLRSWGKVGQSLGVSRLKLHPVYLPIKAVTGKLQYFKAKLFAAWWTANKWHMSQQKIAEIYNISPSTQLRYCRIAGIQSKPQYALGETYTQETAHETAYERGNKTFIFTDYKGKQGKAGQKYLAWRLPNEIHHTGLNLAPRGMQRKHNRQLTDLFNEGLTGNGRGKQVRIFHPTVGKAVQYVRKYREAVDAYFTLKPPPKRRCVLWGVILGE